jgi:hypothetical protein
MALYFEDFLFIHKDRGEKGDTEFIFRLTRWENGNITFKRISPPERHGPVIYPTENLVYIALIALYKAAKVNNSVLKSPLSRDFLKDIMTVITDDEEQLPSKLKEAVNDESMFDVQTPIASVMELTEFVQPYYAYQLTKVSTIPQLLRQLASKKRRQLPRPPNNDRNNGEPVSKKVRESSCVNRSKQTQLVPPDCRKCRQDKFLALRMLEELAKAEAALRDTKVQHAQVLKQLDEDRKKEVEQWEMRVKMLVEERDDSNKRLYLVQNLIDDTVKKFCSAQLQLS